MMKREMYGHSHSSHMACQGVGSRGVFFWTGDEKWHK